MRVQIRILVVCAAALISAGCQKRGIQELVREELFPLALGKLEDQIDLFQSDGVMGENVNVVMSDGLFYIGNGRSDKVMVFTSYGDLIHLLYNPDTNPAPVLLSESADADTVSTRGCVSFPFKSIGEIAVSGEKTLYVEDAVPDGRGAADEASGTYLDRVVLRFDRKGRPDGYIGQEGVGGTPFPYITGLFVTGRDNLVVACRLPEVYEVFWYSKEGSLLYRAEIDPKKLPQEKGLIPSLTNLVPDMQKPELYLMIHYYRETIDQATKSVSSVETASSRVYALDVATGAYGKYVELPPNPSRKEKAGFKTTEIPAPPNELLGVGADGRFYLLGFLDSNLYALTVLDGGGRVRERRYMVIEDSELTYRDIRLSPSGMVYGLLCDDSTVHVSRWRSDLLLKGD
jgi:hypothetical protein